jgi:hypothetical protein
LKADPGRVGLKTLLGEIEKLERVRAIGLADDLFADVSERQLAAWRARAAKLYPSDLRAAPEPVRLTLLAALCWTRTAEITDGISSVRRRRMIRRFASACGRCCAPRTRRTIAGCCRGCSTRSSFAARTRPTDP